ncbi:hypothetical protein Tco_1541358 [Tanacetum coccineum]
MAARVMAGVSDVDDTTGNFRISKDRYEDNRMSDPIGGLEFLGSSGIGSLPSGRVDITGDENPTHEDGDIEIGDSTEVSVSFGDEIFSKGLGKMFLGKITVVTLVEEQMSPWKGNLPKLPIESNIVRLATTSIGTSLFSSWTHYDKKKEMKCEVIGNGVRILLIGDKDLVQCVMQSTLSTKGMRSIISTVSISLEGFMPSILLLVVTVVIVAVILVVVVVVAIVGVVIVVMIIRVVVACWAYEFHQVKASSVRVPVENVTLSSLAHLLRENTDSVRSNQRMRPTAPSLGGGVVDRTGVENPTDEDGDIEIGDSTEVSVSFGDEIFLKGLGKMFPGEAGK